MDKFRIGDRVKINHSCVSEYWDLTGTIQSIDPQDSSDPNDQKYFVKFDKEFYGIYSEYFSEGELDVEATKG